MRRIQTILCLLLASFVLVQCQRELSNVGSPDPGVIIPEPITATIQGNIVDENDQPASGVQIRVGAKTATTNASGYFRITDASLDKVTALVTAEKGGYFKAYRTFSATSGVNQVMIKLIKRDLAGTVNGASGGDATLANGAKINLKANGVVNAATGAAYTGTVNVYAAYIDPTAADISSFVPGSFMAIDKNNRRVTMASFGMMAVELEGSAGEKLQLKTGSPATLTTPIPASAQSGAPASIALWYVDEQTGLWKEQGTATKQGSAYVGEVSHFSFWNCDIGIPAVTLTLKVYNSNNQPIVHAHVRIKRTTGGGWSQASGFTDSLGQVSGLVPANENLVLEVLSRCNTPIYTQNIGPFTTNTHLGIITVPSTTSGVINLTGKLITCSGTPVVNGYAIVVVDNVVRYVRADSATGNFATSILVCSGPTPNYSIIGVDVSALQQGNAVTGTLNAPATAVGNVSACGNSAAQYLNYTLDGTSYSVVPPADSLVAFTMQVQGTTNWRTIINSGVNSAGSSMGLNFRFNSPTQAAGSYPIDELMVRTYVRNNTPVVPFNVNVTNFPTTVGSFYEGNFNGQFRDSLNVLHNLNATFRIRKNF